MEFSEAIDTLPDALESFADKLDKWSSENLGPSLPVKPVPSIAGTDIEDDYSELAGLFAVINGRDRLPCLPGYHWAHLVKATTLPRHKKTIQHEQSINRPEEYLDREYQAGVHCSLLEQWANELAEDMRKLNG